MEGDDEDTPITMVTASSDEGMEKLYRQMVDEGEMEANISLYFQGEDPSAGNPNFWDELFLLKVSPFISYPIHTYSSTKRHGYFCDIIAGS